MTTTSNSSDAIEVLFAGLPTSGKTTYLALLYTAVAQGRTDHLELGHYRDDREYVNRISTQLLRCEEAKHTDVDEPGQLSLSLLVGESQRPVVLRIPDLSGETWEHALYDRSWPLSLSNSARTAMGVLLFLHVREFDAGPSIASAQLAELALQSEDEAIDVSEDKAEAGDNDTIGPHHQPTQVQVVDLLQLLFEESAQRPARVGIVLSAWDLTNQKTKPAEWLETNAPLAWQYLAVNSDWLDSRVWGMSAQGGSFRDAGQREQLLRKDAVDRARAINDIGEPGSVDDPTLWAMRAEAP